MLRRLYMLISGDMGDGRPIMRPVDWLVIAGIVLALWLVATGRLTICDPTPGPDSVYSACPPTGWKGLKS